MTDDGRMVYMTPEQHAEIERYILELMRAHHNERASTMMNLALAYKFAEPPKPPSNVVEMHGYSRKAPCA